MDQSKSELAIRQVLNQKIMNHVLGLVRLIITLPLDPMTSGSNTKPRILKYSFISLLSSRLGHGYNIYIGAAPICNQALATV